LVALNPVGIEKIGVWPGTLRLGMADLCAARGHDLAQVRDDMLIDERSVNPLWEDPVTMAVNAANTMLNEDDRARIELLVVATESGVDYEKPLSTWVHRYLRLGPNCRNFEIKHACYGGTAGLQMAAHWIATGLNHGAKALIICTDQSRVHFGKPWEYVLGAGAACVLLSGEPRIAEIEVGKSGYWTFEVSDLTRPTSTTETGNSETSLISYLEGLDGAFDHFVQRVPEAADYDATFRKHIYHAPFGGMTFRAHKTIMRRFGRMSKDVVRAHFDRKTSASLTHLRRMGGTYSASTFIGLLGMLETSTDLAPGDRLSMFSYGSGSCAEFYCIRCGTDAAASARGADAAGRLDARFALSVADYESIEGARVCLADRSDYDVPLDEPSGWFDGRYRGSSLLVFTGVKDFYRQYAWS
jgi:3-hydroxy-3-methylglutaryl CoA synthase